MRAWLKRLLGPILKNWHETGRQDGMEWAMRRATRRELEYVSTAFKTQKERGKLVSYNPTKDDVIGPVFGQVFERYRFSWQETEPYAYIPETRYEAWEQGFVEAVREYWEKMKS